MDERHLKILSKVWSYQNVHDEPPSLKDLGYAEGRKIQIGDLEYLFDRGFIDWGHNPSSAITLKHNGVDKLQDYLLLEEIEKNRQFNQKLMEQEKRSSAVETLFTITLVVFSFVQVTTLLLTENLNSKFILIPGLTLGMVAIVYIALEINGENLNEVIEQTEWSFPLASKGEKDG